MEGEQREAGRKARHHSLASLGIHVRQLVEEKLRSVPNMVSWCFVKRDGKMFVKVETKEGEQT